MLPLATAIPHFECAQSVGRDSQGLAIKAGSGFGGSFDLPNSIGSGEKAQ